MEPRLPPLQAQARLLEQEQAPGWILLREQGILQLKSHHRLPWEGVRACSLHRVWPGAQREAGHDELEVQEVQGALPQQIQLRERDQAPPRLVQVRAQALQLLVQCLLQQTLTLMQMNEEGEGLVYPLVRVRGEDHVQ